MLICFVCKIWMYSHNKLLTWCLTFYSLHSRFTQGTKSGVTMLWQGQLYIFLYSLSVLVKLACIDW
jgi:hypothetical protein